MTFLLSIIKELDADWTKVQTLILANKLGEDIEYRIHHYTKCISKSNTNFADWLKDDYEKKLRLYIYVIISTRILKKFMEDHRKNNKSFENITIQNKIAFLLYGFLRTQTESLCRRIKN